MENIISEEGIIKIINEYKYQLECKDLRDIYEDNWIMITNHIFMDKKTQLSDYFYFLQEYSDHIIWNDASILLNYEELRYNRDFINMFKNYIDWNLFLYNFTSYICNKKYSHPIDDIIYHDIVFFKEYEEYFNWETQDIFYLYFGNYKNLFRRNAHKYDWNNIMRTYLMILNRTNDNYHYNQNFFYKEQCNLINFILDYKDYIIWDKRLLVLISVFIDFLIIDIYKNETIDLLNNIDKKTLLNYLLIILKKYSLYFCSYEIKDKINKIDYCIIYCKK